MSQTCEGFPRTLALVVCLAPSLWATSGTFLCFLIGGGKNPVHSAPDLTIPKRRCSIDLGLFRLDIVSATTHLDLFGLRGFLLSAVPRARRRAGPAGARSR